MRSDHLAKHMKTHEKKIKKLKTEVSSAESDENNKKPEIIVKSELLLCGNDVKVEDPLKKEKIQPLAYQEKIFSDRTFYNSTAELMKTNHQTSSSPAFLDNSYNHPANQYSYYNSYNPGMHHVPADIKPTYYNENSFHQSNIMASHKDPVSSYSYNFDPATTGSQMYSIHRGDAVQSYPVANFGSLPSSNGCGTGSHGI